MQITITGTLEGRGVHASWTDGELDGDFELVARVRAMVELGTPVTMAGVWAGPASLDDEHAAQATLWSAVDPPRELGGDPVEAARLDRGDVAG